MSSKIQLRRFSNRIVGCPGCGEPRDDLRDDPDGAFVLYEDYERLMRERDQASAIVGELAALIPLSETIEATQTGTAMIRWFKERLRSTPAPEPRDG